MSVPTATRRLEFDAAHRVLRHESKCRHVHGHRYVAEVTCAARDLDGVGRVIDYSVIKRELGGWIDNTLDHGYIAHPDDDIAAIIGEHGFNLFTMPRELGNPTAENLAVLIYDKGNELLNQYGVSVVHVRIYETPNCWADYAGPHRAGGVED